MKAEPRPGEVYFVDLGIAAKPMMILIVSVHDPNCPLAIATGLALTRQFHDSRYEVPLPKLPWMRDQSYINAQSLSGFKFVELGRMIGKLEPSVMNKIQDAIKLWLNL